MGTALRVAESLQESLPLYFGYLGRFYIPDHGVLGLKQLVTNSIQYIMRERFAQEMDTRLNRAQSIEDLENLYHISRHELLFCENEANAYVRKISDKAILRSSRKFNNATSMTSVAFI